MLPYRFLEVKTLVFVDRESEPERVKEAERLGALIADRAEAATWTSKTPEDLAAMGFQRVIATEAMSDVVRGLSRVLGPMGLMPTTKKGTITNDIAKAMSNAADTILFKTDHSGYLSVGLGRVEMPLKQVEANIVTLLDELKASKKGKKTRFVDRMSVQAEGTPEILVDHSQFKI
jgi:large subunit ribosomal protein L1